MFCNDFNKFNNTGAHVLDSIYHMTFKLHVLKIASLRENDNNLPSFTQRYNWQHFALLLNL